MKRKMVIILQHESKDCGPCALKSIIEYYGGYVSLEKIREHAYTSEEGTTVYHLVNAAKKYGFDAIAKKYLDSQISNITLPAIVHIRYETGLTHYMVIYKINSKHVILMDPAKGKVTMNITDFEKIFSGVTVELIPKCEIISLDKESSIYNLFFSIIKKNKNICFNLLICSILLTFFTILSGVYFKVSYEYITTSSFITTINYIIYLFLTIFLLKVVYEYYTNYYKNILNKNIDVSIYKNFIAHVFKLPLKVINTRPIGEIVTRVNELGNVKDIFSQFFISCFLELILSIGSIIMLFYIDSKLALILIIVMLVYIFISFLFNPYLYRRIRKNIDNQTEVNSCLIENLNMINSIKNLNKISETLNTIEMKISSLIYDNYTFTNELNIFIFFQNFVSEIGIFFINTYGFYLIFSNNLSLVDLVIFNNLMMYFINPIKNMIAIIPNYNFLRASFNKICDFIDLEEETLGKKEKFINGDICFKSVEFSYNDYSKIMESFDLTIKQGEKLMIKGKSGCGKSTLCQMLQKTYQPTKGSIYIGKKNILDYSMLTLRNSIVYVGQKENLYTDTIKNNIKFYDESEDFDKVCRICLIDQIVSKKAFRYDFGIDSNFANISGGEKQRIVLARALLRKGPILILDEALSELDFYSEMKIIKNIKREYPDKTLIYISHKKHDNLFDRVITMESSL